MPTTSEPSVIRADFVFRCGKTGIDRVFESGSLRLRRPRGSACEAIIVNTGGGIVGGDRLCIDLSLAAGAEVTATTVAAEKVYRSAGPWSETEVGLHLAARARLDWLPQETIVFDSARLRRRFDANIAADARLLVAETLVFGRLASRETSIHGLMRESWRIRRAGKLVFADESRLEGAIGAILDRPAIADGARAMALILLIASDADTSLDAVRDRLAPFMAAAVESGVSCRDGVLVAKLVAKAPERLRDAVAAALTAIGGRPPPRVWQS